MNLQRIKEVYVVFGLPNTGKTTVLSQLCDHLKNNVPASDYDELLLGNGDKCVKARWAAGRVIGVGTAGDSADCILENFLYFNETGASIQDTGCDAVVIAVTHHSGRNALRYRPNLTTAQIELEEVIMPAFIPSVAIPPPQIQTHRIHGNCANCAQQRINATNAIFWQLRTVLNV